MRFIGIDTPERGECGYKEAKARLSKLIAGRTVSTVDVPGNVKDRWGRELGYVELDGRDIGHILLLEGLAHARYDSLDGYPRHPRQEEYRWIDAAIPNPCG